MIGLSILPALVYLAAATTLVNAAQPIYGQCGGTGWSESSVSHLKESSSLTLFVQLVIPLVYLVQFALS